MRDSSKLVIGVAAAILAAAVASPASAKNIKLAVDGYFYQLPEGAEKNMEAVSALVAASNGMGMSRIATWQNNITEGDGGRSCVGCTTDFFEYKGTGTYQGQTAQVVSLKFDYRIPAVRADVTTADGTRTVKVAKGDLTWDESTPGVLKGKSDETAAERLIPVLMLPPAAVIYGRMAAPTIKVSAASDGTRDLTVPLPVLNTDMTAKIDANGHVIHTELTYGGKTYTGDYSNFLNDHMDYHVYGPHRIVQKVDGKVVTDLTLEYHWTDPYLVFPTPKELASK